MTVIIPDKIHTQIQRHLEGVFPNEGGGFLIGRLENGKRVITDIRFEENTFETEEQYHRYFIEGRANETYWAAEDAADSQGLSLLGYFHSHPNHPAIPSEFDRIHAWPRFLYLIVSVREGQAAESLAWELADNRERFDPVTLEELKVN